MSTTSDRDVSIGGGEPNPLAELLACERELAERLSRAQADAVRLVEEARSEVARAQADLEASLVVESERARARIREETRASVREISTRARERAALYDGVSDERVTRLADGAFRRLLGAEGEP